jgi:hypothetical protein
MHEHAAPARPSCLPPQAAYYDDIPEDTAAQAGAATGFVFLICLMANTMAMLLAWFFIFDTIQKEKDILERGHTDVAAVAQAGAQPGAPPAAPGALPATADGEGVGGSTHPYANEILLQDAGGNVSHAYVDVVGELAGAARSGAAAGAGQAAAQPSMHRSAGCKPAGHDGATPASHPASIIKCPALAPLVQMLTWTPQRPLPTALTIVRSCAWWVVRQGDVHINTRQKCIRCWGVLFNTGLKRIGCWRCCWWWGRCTHAAPLQEPSLRFAP